jgi:hypothetical protein
VYVPAAPAVPATSYVQSTVDGTAVVAYSTIALLKSLSAGFVQRNVTCALPLVAVRDVTSAGEVTSGSALQATIPSNTTAAHMDVQAVLISPFFIMVIFSI